MYLSSLKHAPHSHVYCILLPSHSCRARTLFCGGSKEGEEEEEAEEEEAEEEEEGAEEEEEEEEEEEANIM